MPKKSKWQSNLWKTVVALSIIFALIASVLQIFEIIDLRSLILPLSSFLTSSVSLYYVVLFVAVLVILVYSLIKLKGHRGNILDSEYGRHIAILCQTPRTTEYLRQKYEEWESGSKVIVVGGYGFDDYMKLLEKQGYLKYRNEKWEVTDKALDYIDKYHGG